MAYSPTANSTFYKRKIGIPLEKILPRIANYNNAKKKSLKHSVTERKKDLFSSTKYRYMSKELLQRRLSTIMFNNSQKKAEENVRFELESELFRKTLLDVKRLIKFDLSSQRQVLLDYSRSINTKINNCLKKDVKKEKRYKKVDKKKFTNVFHKDAHKNMQNRFFNERVNKFINDEMEECSQRFRAVRKIYPEQQLEHSDFLKLKYSFKDYMNKKIEKYNLNKEKKDNLNILGKFKKWSVYKYNSEIGENKEKTEVLGQKILYMFDQAGNNLDKEYDEINNVYKELNMAIDKKV